MTGRPSDRWIIDFPPGTTENQAALYEAPFLHVVERVKPLRLGNKREGYARQWWIHGEPRPSMRAALGRLPRFLVTVSVAKHRLFRWLPQPTLPDHKLFVFARDDDYVFGVLQSKVHQAWALATSSRHGVGNDPVHNNTTCFETFPLPWAPGAEPTSSEAYRDIAQAAERLNNLRENWLRGDGLEEAELKKRTLTNLYNDPPTWLTDTHDRHDRAVLRAYGWPEDLGDAEILARLMALNEERSAGQTASAPDAASVPAE